jgi:lysozyme family protein
MANVEKFVPILIQNEASIILLDGETNESLFERARAKGWSNHKKDRGGETMIGVTLKTYTAYCKKNGLKTPDANALKNIPYKHWVAILKEMYWDVAKADRYDNQSVANIIVDWCYNSGTKVLRNVQEIVGADVDGVVGNQTIAAINEKDQYGLFERLKIERLKYYDDIIRKDPSQACFQTGWYNRIDRFTFKS